MYKFIVKVVESRRVREAFFVEVNTNFQLFEFQVEANEAKKALEYYHRADPNVKVFVDSIYE